MTVHQGWGVLSLLALLLPAPDGAGETAEGPRARDLLYLRHFGVGVLHVVGETEH